MEMCEGEPPYMEFPPLRVCRGLYFLFYFLFNRYLRNPTGAFPDYNEGNTTLERGPQMVTRAARFPPEVLEQRCRPAPRCYCHAQSIITLIFILYILFTYDFLQHPFIMKAGPPGDLAKAIKEARHAKDNMRL